MSFASQVTEQVTYMEENKQPVVPIERKRPDDTEGGSCD